MPRSQLIKQKSAPVPDLTGKVALVTGGNRGIGKTIVLGLAQAGAAVAFCSRTDELNRRLEDELIAANARCFSQAVDVRDAEVLDLFLVRCQEVLGKLDILVNNAGIYVNHPVAGHSLELWNEVLETNLTSAMLTCRAVIPAMIEAGWGRIINISSISGKTAESNGSAYCASKFGLIGLSQTLALETARHGITVNALCPGWVNTDLSQVQINDHPQLTINPPTESNQELDTHELTRLSIPQERFIEPDEIAALVLFLCSHGARGITGQALNICGGLSLH